MLGSVATLMHETYLPVYLADELGVSNTNVGCPEEGGEGGMVYPCQQSGRRH